MTHVKVCGITNTDDAALSRDLGAAAIGLNFVRESPRCIDLETACQIAENIGPKTEIVGVFVNDSLERIKRIAEQVKLDAVQLHGDESARFVSVLRQEIGLKVIKAFRVSSDFSPSGMLEYEVDAILLDSYSRTAYGGTGETCDWAMAARLAVAYKNVFLAGGIGPDNVAQAIDIVRPWAIDVCSGVEKVKGKKDPLKMRKLFEAINNSK